MTRLFTRYVMWAPFVAGLFFALWGCQSTPGELVEIQQGPTEVDFATVHQQAQEISEQVRATEIEVQKMLAEAEHAIKAGKPTLGDGESPSISEGAPLPPGTIELTIQAQEARLQAIDSRELAVTARVIANLSTDPSTKQEWYAHAKDYDERATLLLKQANDWEQFAEGLKTAEVVQRADAAHATLQPHNGF